MRILLFGNPSTLHSNLAKGLRELGHEVRCISNRTGWRMFPVDDILLERRHDINGKLAFFDYLRKAVPLILQCRNYDIVQLNNPMFLCLRGTHIRPFYDYLRRHNKRMVLGAFGDDYHIVDQMLHGDHLRYSDQRIGDVVREDDAAVQQRREWVEDGSTQREISKYISRDCDAIVACLQEYWADYNRVYPDKLSFLPLPIVMDEDEDAAQRTYTVGPKVKLFIGIQRERSVMKGTDIMLRAAQDVVRDYPDLATLHVAENVPYAEYCKLMEGYDAILDQLYSYTPSMNSLLAMSKGIIDIGGGEPENYEILGETSLRPIVNVYPTYQSVYDTLRDFIHHPERIPDLKRQSVEYVRKHHDYRKVARQYETLYKELLKQ